MISEPLTPRQWLEDNPLRPGESLYAVISSTSDADPLAAYRQQGGVEPPDKLWADTAYADWLPVMPYLLKLTPDSEFIQWAAQTDADDWGWLAISTASPQRISEHLRSLTQVLMPSGEAVFFRFWDGRHWLPILQHLGTATRDVLPVFDRYWINGQPVTVGQGEVLAAPTFPWWQVPDDLLDSLAEQDLNTVIDNLMQWLKDAHAPLYASIGEAHLRLKVEHFVQRSSPTQRKDSGLLLAHVQQEVCA